MVKTNQVKVLEKEKKINNNDNSIYYEENYNDGKRRVFRVIHRPYNSIDLNSLLLQDKNDIKNQYKEKIRNKIPLFGTVNRYNKNPEVFYFRLLNNEYKILIQKKTENTNEEYIYGYKSNKNKNEIIFEINSNYEILNDYIEYKYIKIGKHFHKNEKGIIYNYCPIQSKELSDIINFKCSSENCDSKANYIFSESKFEVICEHKEKDEKDCSGNSDNFLVKQIIDFMKNNSEINDIQFIHK